MNFWEHVEELRMAILRSLGGIILGVILSVVFFIKFFYVLRMPLEKAMAREGGILVGLTTTNVMGVFSVLIQVCMVGGVAIGMPFVIYNFAKFVGPGLSAREKRVLVPSCIAIFFLFLLGALFAFFVVLPAALEASLFFNRLLGLDAIWTAQSYYGLVVWMLIGVGGAFEFPLVIVLLQYIGVVSPQGLRDGRRYAVIIILICAALITPGGDPVTMMFLAIPLLVFYEVSIIVGAKLAKPEVEED